MSASGDKQPNRFHFLWRETPPCEHFLQVYDHDQGLIDSLEGFTAAGLRAGDGVIVIATAAHLDALEQRLRSLGFSLAIARSRDQYLAFDAEETLSQFMVRGEPDEVLFKQLVQGLVARAGAAGRKVRAFGEMVAVLWGRGERAATVRLEQLWHSACREHAFSLFCAYPQSCFAGDADPAIMEIRAAHSTMVA